MKISRKILSLPPYISTSWENVSSLHVEEKNYGLVLIVELRNNSKVEVPNLDGKALEAIFEAHTKFLEEENSQLPQERKENLPFNLNFGANAEALGNVMQHNPQQKDAPNLPPEVLTKITGVAKILGINDPHNLPKAEPHCNCVYCQIAKALNGETPEAPVEEVVKDEELTFRAWDIKQNAEKLYQVNNPLDAKEAYHVYLGDPIGCTCGQKNCEHIRAVLNS
jgi:hypothetical protein